MTLNRVKSIKILTHYVVHLKLIYYCKSTILQFLKKATLGPQLLSLYSRACKPQIPSLHTTTTEARVP